MPYGELWTDCPTGASSRCLLAGPVEEAESGIRERPGRIAGPGGWDLQLAWRPVIDGLTHLRLILSQISVGSGDCWIAATSGQRVTPRSARNLSMTPSSSARRGPKRI